ncbi:MAG: hypothetical protein A3G60_01690 [Candidatus Ryanbacteria bacterium RIFCSPLOWO2_12_FULL_47_9c]|uniref:Uncharacterized protein n=1 Tax=Candidatus Ryanbacteria bacterium RIFCSPLOWO2_12_FULL_47_9c TaxID=1802131 RepID=A0A1G2H4R8_9BACT|nr:MAG: hypothetical protein A3G60_01690 [Candidatus Ryanbacteria bacterium RIFCSPLOWO2_12_FULL_47_9c]
MKFHIFKNKSLKKSALILAALVLIGGSFTVASASFTGSPGSLLAGVFSIFDSSPLIKMSRNVNSPSGSVISGKTQVIGTFDVQTQNVTNFATLRTLTAQFALSGKGAKEFNLEDFTLSYRYCIPPGISYGYGYRGGSCGTIKMPVTSAERKSNLYTVTSRQALPVYPVQSSGVLTMSAKPVYTGQEKSESGKSWLRVSVKGEGSGDKCNKIYYGYNNRYGYTKCIAEKARVTSAKGNWLTMTRPYGY